VSYLTYPAACPPGREKPEPVAPSLLENRRLMMGVKWLRQRRLERVIVVRSMIVCGCAKLA